MNTSDFSLNNELGSDYWVGLGIAINKLGILLDDADLNQKITLTFGSNTNINLAKSVISDLVNSQNLPQIKIVTAATINGAKGAFDRFDNTVYLASEFLTQNANNQEAVASVILEEFGHYIDAKINIQDAAGDEGAIFSTLAQGKTLSEAEISSLKSENDSTTIVVNGEARTVELSATYGNITIDGNASDWTAADRLETPGTTLPGYEIYAKYAGDNYIFAVKSDSNPIGAGTTFWLNTDRNANTGYSIFGVPGLGGSEYNIDFSATGQPSLYTGGAGETLVNGALDFAYDTNNQFVEFAVPISQLNGTPQAIDVLTDINNLSFLPGDYATQKYTVTTTGNNPPPPPAVFGNITLDGNLSDWTVSDRLDYKLGSGQPGFEIYGKYSGDAYIFAFKSASTQIGAGTTVWLNTDRNPSTGYPVFGTPGIGGSEYNINFSADGKPYLYTGAAAQNIVSNSPVDFAYGSNNQIVEFAVKISDLNGAPQAIDVLTDINNQSFLPGDYVNQKYTVFATPPVLPARTDFSKNVGIVFSETTAKQFFDQKAYTQLFLSMQYQAMQAGIPFDILTENDLTDINKIANYDALIFPSFRNVEASKLEAIEQTLSDAVYKYNIGIITAGDFLTNDENNNALAGDAYIRMKQLLNVARNSGGGPVNGNLIAEDITHSVMEDYTAGEEIRSYNNIFFNSYDDGFTNDDNKPTVLADFQVGDQKYNAVVATQTGGRNVHFATEAFMGDNNLVWKALQWAVLDNKPSVRLNMSRDASIFISRNDMDQSQEFADVNPVNNQGQELPGVYDKMLPIIENWKQNYDFVGSYYINVGNDPANGQYTDWTISKPYYDRMLALGNEIGTHSYTHPDNTGLLTPAQLEFEFNQSKAVIEQQLGIQVKGAAIPGNPEPIGVSTELSKYLDYVTGGYSGVGAGYPNAFGFMFPGSDFVYMAPNMSFDFSLIEFNKLTPQQAEAKWAQEYQQLTSKSGQAILHFPWHDYAPTVWDTDPTDTIPPPPYSEQMFTNVIANAYNNNTEFVTELELSQRIKSFEKSKLFIDTNGNTITAKVQSLDTGAFGLNVEKGQTIQSVTNWYAYDKDTVFLPATGGEFKINLGAVQDDVTRIIDLPMRAELTSVVGDGINLDFSFIGAGKVTLDVQNPLGLKLFTQGADSTIFDGNILQMNFNSFTQHTAKVKFLEDVAPIVASPIANITVNEDASVTTIDLTNVFTDVDDPQSGIFKTILANSNSNLVTTNIVNNILTLNYLPNQFGTSQVTIRATSGGKTVDNTFSVNVNPIDDAPLVANAIANVNINEDAASTVIDLANVFTDIDNDPTAIVKTVQANSNGSLINATIVDGKLTLTPQANQFGTSQITIRGTSNGLSVDNTFSVNVNPVDDAPIVAKAIADITVNQDAASTVIDLSTVFTDIDNSAAAIIKTVKTNSNTEVVNATIVGNKLTVDYQPNQFGTTQITVTGTSNGLKVDNTFNVNVKAVGNIINGTAAANTINGTSARDIIYGLGGNDTIYAKGGNDTIFGGDGNDIVQGDDGTDIVYGDAGNDNLRGNAGSDKLTGGKGNDTLLGGGGVDTLIGVNPSDTLAGLGEIDILTGGTQADLFVLGDRNQAYYNDGNNITSGTGDYAQITDFSRSQGDKIQLHGSAANYKLGSTSLTSLLTGTNVFLTTGGQDELIAVVKGDTLNLSLTSTAFTFV
jgi:serralysin